MKCCHVDCTNDAGFQILTERIENGDGTMAGPDPLCDSTEACVEHVGHLLGWQPDCRNPEQVYWTVLQVNAEQNQ